ncbi:Protein argonaute 16 [Camellia lanceoleosa]|uniref:Protein argonaute 16 n=1 Tax=Camellia lanceoleosa TaxID=1840588 RepID=A0ACC0F1D7_9ERIC|nr:Protein argonaute 16 [Camellia lanceoleosa]
MWSKAWQSAIALKTYCYDDDPLFVACGISIEKQLTQVDGHVLEAPKLKVGNGEDCIPRNGRWNFNKKNGGKLSTSLLVVIQVIFPKNLLTVGYKFSSMRDSRRDSLEWVVESDDESEEESESPLLSSLPSSRYALDDVGSRSHVHLSLWENGKNIFMASGGHSKYGMSKVGEEFMAGVVNHLPSILAFTAPLPNSLRALKKLVGAKKQDASSDPTDGILSNEDFQRIKELNAKKEARIALAKHGLLRKGSDAKSTAFKNGGSSNRQKEHKKAMPLAAKRSKVCSFTKSPHFWFNFNSFCNFD